MFWNAPTQFEIKNKVSHSEGALRRTEGAQLIYGRQISVCLWFLAKNTNARTKRGFRDRSVFQTQLS